MVSELGWSSPVLALVAGVALAVAIGSAGFAGRRHRCIPMVLWAGVVSFLGLAGYLSRSDGWEFTPVDSAIGAFAGVGFGLGAMFLIRALAAGSFSVVAPTAALAGIAIPHMIGLALGRTPTAFGLLGILLAVGAISMLVRGEPSAAAKQDVAEQDAAEQDVGQEVQPSGTAKLRADSLVVDGLAGGAVLAVLAGVAGGVGLALLHGTDAASGASPLLVASGTSVLAVVALSVFTKKLVIAPDGGLLAAVLAGGGAAAGGVLYLEAIATGAAATALALGTSWAGFLWLLGVVILREAIAKDRWLAAVLAIGAAVLLSIAVSRGSVARNDSEPQQALARSRPGMLRPVESIVPQSWDQFPPSSGSARHRQSS